MYLFISFSLLIIHEDRKVKSYNKIKASNCVIFIVYFPTITKCKTTKPES